MKKLTSKIITFALTLCLIVPCVFMLTACAKHTHTLTKVAAVSATCTTAGNEEYYKCDCGKFFSDDKAENEIENNSWVIPATGHTYATTWTYNETHHWKEATCDHSTEKGDYAEHTLTNNECACGYVAVVYTVDESEWNDVFTGEYLTNATLTMETEYYTNDVLDEEMSGVQLLKSTETAMVMEMEEESQYLVLQDDVWYGLSEYEGTWYGVEMPDEFAEFYTFAGGQGYLFVDKYDAFVYDEVNKCYVTENFVIDPEEELSADEVKVYIENGKLVKMEMTVTIDATSNAYTEYVFSDYGTTVVTAPTWTEIPQ